MSALLFLFYNNGSSIGGQFLLRPNVHFLPLWNSRRWLAAINQRRNMPFSFLLVFIQNKDEKRWLRERKSDVMRRCPSSLKGLHQLTVHNLNNGSWMWKLVIYANSGAQVQSRGWWRGKWKEKNPVSDPNLYHKYHSRMLTAFPDRPLIGVIWLADSAFQIQQWYVSSKSFDSNDSQTQYDV